MFQLVDQPHHFPGKSVRLGETVGPLVDCGCELALGGWVYLSKTEVWEAARLFGFAEPEAAQQLRDDVELLQAIVAALESQLEQAQAQQLRVVPFDDVLASVASG